ncbi:MAG TPA: hypothetical protein VGR20_22400 [Acidimicrobiia bacterium]|nr:hypothetical protein [Acidimicrobiia bacterium]
MTPTCLHGNVLGACLDCHREKNNPDLVTGASDESAGPTRNGSGGIVLRETGQNYFITTISGDDLGYWTISKEKGLWGTRLQSSKAASEVRADDLIVVWEAKRGIRAVLKAVSLAQRPRTLDEFPWPDPELYVYLFPIEVLVELDEPVGDDFDQPDRISARFGLKNAEVQPGFRRLPREQMSLILEAVEKAGV